MGSRDAVGSMKQDKTHPSIAFRRGRERARSASNSELSQSPGLPLPPSLLLRPDALCYAREDPQEGLRLLRLGPRFRTRAQATYLLLAALGELTSSRRVQHSRQRSDDRSPHRGALRIPRNQRAAPTLLRSPASARRGTLLCYRTPGIRDVQEGCASLVHLRSSITNMLSQLLWTRASCSQRRMTWTGARRTTCSGPLWARGRCGSGRRKHG